MKRFLYGLICLLPLAPAVHAQDTKTGGSPPKTVAGEKNADAVTLGIPKPASDLHPGTYHYQATLEVGGQKMNLKVTAAITDGGSSWTALDTMDTPQGLVTDTATIEKKTLILRKHIVQQGPFVIDLDFAGDKAAGKMSVNGQDKLIAADLGGPLFADAAGGDQVIANLPLAVGYATTFRNFDILTQQPKMQQLKVTGVETVTVPAGTFDAFRVEVTSADGGADKKTLWVDRDSLKVVKGFAVIASMGGATITQELTE